MFVPVTLFPKGKAVQQVQLILTLLQLLKYKPYRVYYTIFLPKEPK